MPSALPSRPLSVHPLYGLLAMALAHVAVRVAVSPALKWDEAEQMLWSQQLALGYGSQPPLYTWLQWLANQVFGPSVLALSALKHALLALSFALMYRAGRALLDERGAFWASASMLLLPPLYRCWARRGAAGLVALPRPELHGVDGAGGKAEAAPVAFDRRQADEHAGQREGADDQPVAACGCFRTGSR